MSVYLIHFNQIKLAILCPIYTNRDVVIVIGMQ